MGGYTTWSARSAGLEVEAEPKIVETVLKLLEEVAGKPRRALPKLESAYSHAVMQSKPRGYWRLTEVAGNLAADSSGNHLDGEYDGNVAHYLPGPTGKGMHAGDATSRAAHFASGRLHARVPGIGHTYSAEFWFWNGLPYEARRINAYLFSRTADGKNVKSGDCLGIGGVGLAAGELFFSGDSNVTGELAGGMQIERRTWNHIVLVRDGMQVRVYLNGKIVPEFGGSVTAASDVANAEWSFAGRAGDSVCLEGKMSEVALYDRALFDDEVKRHYDAALSPSSN